MGKLQIRRGAQVPAQLAAGEPFFDGTDLHVGKLAGTGGNQKIGGETGATIKTKLEALQGDARLDASAIKNLPTGEGGGATTTIVEWAIGDEKPVLDADWVVGDFIEGKTHVVALYSLEDNRQLAVISIARTSGATFTPFNNFNPSEPIRANAAGNMAYIVFGENTELYVIDAFGSYKKAIFTVAVWGALIDNSNNVYIYYQYGGNFRLSRLTASLEIDDSIYIDLGGEPHEATINGDYIYVHEFYQIENVHRILRYNKNTFVADSAFNAAALSFDEIGTFYVDQSALYAYTYSVVDDRYSLIKLSLATGIVDNAFTPALDAIDNINLVGTYDGYLYVHSDNLEDIIKINQATGVIDESYTAVMGDMHPYESNNTHSRILGQYFYLFAANEDGAALSVIDLSTNQLLSTTNYLTWFEPIASGFYGVDPEDGALKRYNLDGSKVPAPSGDFIIDRVNRALPAPTSGVISSAGIHYVISDQTPGITLHKGSMQAGDMITIYNIGTQGLFINALLSNYQINQELQAKNFARFCVLEDRGELALAYMYSSSYIGLNL